MTFKKMEHVNFADTTILVPLKEEDILDLNLMLVDKMLDYRRDPDNRMSQEEFDNAHRLVDVFVKSLARINKK